VIPYLGIYIFDTTIVSDWFRPVCETNVVEQIILAGDHWTKPEDFYQTLLSSLGSPNWHGHNLDALWDSITSGDIKQVNPPFSVRITGTDLMSPSCKALVDRFEALISAARAEGHNVEISCL
jgi:RNAse (barnase) inhibitor barstar